MYREACALSVDRINVTSLRMTMHCNEKTSSCNLCRTQSSGVVGLEASPCAASTLLRVPIDGPRCPSVPLCRPAIGAKLPFVSLMLHIPNMAHLQFLIASSYSRSQEQSHKTCLQTPGRRIKKARCMYRPESGRTKAKAKAKNDSDSHSSCLLLTVLSHQT